MVCKQMASISRGKKTPKNGIFNLTRLEQILIQRKDLMWAKTNLRTVAVELSYTGKQHHVLKTKAKNDKTSPK